MTPSSQVLTAGLWFIIFDLLLFTINNPTKDMIF
jgi:hypothetical protein